jgi:hypothetical protein
VTGRHGRRLVQESQERGVGNTVKMAKMRDGSNDVFNIVEDTFFFFFFLSNSFYLIKRERTVIPHEKNTRFADSFFDSKDENKTE